MKETQIVTRVEPQPEFPSPEPPPVVYKMPQQQSPIAHGSRSLSEIFGLHVAAAALTIIVDLMVFGSDVFSGGLLIPVGIVIAGVLGCITYRIQRHWYGDPHESAMTKALIVGMLTAIPVPLTPLIAIPGGLVGFVHMLRRKN